MDVKQVESLAETISALSSEDYSLLQSILITKTIQKTTGVCGGHARVRNTRIPVWTLVSLTKQGMDENELLKDFPGLTHFDLLAVQSYYKASKTEIDDLIASHHSDQDWYV
ncbi:MAG: DUF433 domain-containing protein [Cyanobacteria bacterium J06555_13]